MKQQIYTYDRHGVKYHTPIPEGMTKDMMRFIYNPRSEGPIYENSMFSGKHYKGPVPVSYANAPKYLFISKKEEQQEEKNHE
jgi:hypothetical protein